MEDNVCLTCGQKPEGCDLSRYGCGYDPYAEITYMTECPAWVDRKEYDRGKI